MSIRVRSATVEVGESQTLETAQGEDCEYRLSFTDSSGNARDLTGAQAIVMTVRDRASRALIFARSYTGFVGGVGTGAVRFQVLQTDTRDESVQPYDVDVIWTDSSGYKEQLLVASTFHILLGVADDGDTVTSPPAIPVVYGLNWFPGMWSSPSGGYSTNDAIAAYDGSLGATAISTFRCTASGITYYPISSTLALATGWAYVGQHGGVGGKLQVLTSSFSTGIAGVTYGQMLQVSAQSTGATVPVPLATGFINQQVGIKCISTGYTNLVTLAPTGSERIDFRSSLSIGDQECVVLMSDGTNWMVV